MRYLVSAMVTISVSTAVEANSPRAALKIAKERGLTSRFADHGDRDEEWVTSGELDGEPQNFMVEKDPYEVEG